MQIESVDLFMLLDMLDQVTEESCLPLLSKIFAAFLSIKLTLSVHKDFLCLAAIVMIPLSEVGYTNILYSLAKGIGTMRPGFKISIYVPCIGLVEYMLNKNTWGAKKGEANQKQQSSECTCD